MLRDLELSGQGTGIVSLLASAQGPWGKDANYAFGTSTSVYWEGASSAKLLFLVSHPNYGPYERVLPQIHVYTGEGRLPRRTAMYCGWISKAEGKLESRTGLVAIWR